MKLYRAEFVRADDLVHAHINAATIEQASAFAKDFHADAGIQLDRCNIVRIDDTLVGRDRDGLDDMLEYGTVSFASWLPPIGWFVHTAIRPSMKLYRIESDDGGVIQVIAPNAGIASAIWLSSIDLGEDGMYPLWRITEGLSDLDERQHSEMLAFLGFSPQGVVIWDDERGWSLI